VQDLVSDQSPAEQTNEGNLALTEQTSSSLLSAPPFGVEEEPAATQKVDEPITTPTIPLDVSAPSILDPAPSPLPPPTSTAIPQGIPRRHLSWRRAALLLILGSAGGLYAIVSNSTATTQANATATAQANAQVTALVKTMATSNAQATVQANVAATATVQVQATAGVLQTAMAGQPRYSDALKAGNVNDTTWMNDGTYCFFSLDGYHVRVDTRSYPVNHPVCTESDRSYRDAAITVDMRIRGGYAGGLLIRLQSNQFPNILGYFFEVGIGGNYQIAN
jgi:hypothetical protein